MRDFEFNRTIIGGLEQALRKLPAAELQEPMFEVGRRIDAVLDIRLNGLDLHLILEVKRSVFPRDLPKILWQLTKMKEMAPPDRTPVLMVAAESLSEGAKEELRDENFGYFDMGGSLHIPAPGTLILIDKPAAPSVDKAMRSLFSAKRAHVFQALLEDSNRWHNVKELAQITKASPATTSEALTALEEMDWIETRGQGPSKERMLVRPKDLLDKWKRWALATPLKAKRYYVPIINPDELADIVATSCMTNMVPYAFTQEYAAQYYAPFLSNISRVACRMVAGSDADYVLKNLDARRVSEGANLVVIEAKNESDILAGDESGTMVYSSPIQVYLDLLRAGGRAEEMAEHLRRERIGV